VAVVSVKLAPVVDGCGLDHEDTRVAERALSTLALIRSPWVIGGLLLIAVGVGDVIAGRSKLAQYQAVLAQPQETRPRDPARLFPKVTESEEQRAVAAAKLGFYNQLFLGGQLLTVSGLVFIVVGLVRSRRRVVNTPVAAASR